MSVRTAAVYFVMIAFACAPVLSQIGGDAPSTNANRSNANRGRRTPPSTPRVNPPRRPPTTRTPPRRTSDPAATERVFWESIRESRDAEDFREYLRQYPSGTYAGLARNRVRQLEAGSPAPTTSAPTTNTSAPAPTRTTTSRAPVRNQYGMEMVWIPAGSFQMGSTASPDEQPVHQVTIRDGFYMGRYEVTQAQWQAVMGANPSHFQGCANCPVEQVSWNDALEFIRRLNGLNDGYTYRLPSEAEWEYACRAGTTGDFAGSVDAMGWYYENAGDSRLRDAAWSVEQLTRNNNRTHPVGQKQANNFGLYDMHGNVWEWCEDVWHGNYNGAPVDGTSWISGGESNLRGLRGGSWYCNAAGCRSAYRSGNAPDDRGNTDLGFRVVAVART